MGRKTKLSSQVTEDICAALEHGASYEIAAAYASVSDRSIYNWIKRGQDEEARLEALREAGKQARINPKEAIFVRFVRAIEDAKAGAAISWLQVIESAARTDPNWARWMLQVRYPDTYVVKQRQDVDVTTAGKPLPVIAIDIIRPATVEADE